MAAVRVMMRKSASPRRNRRRTLAREGASATSIAVPCSAMSVTNCLLVDGIDRAPRSQGETLTRRVRRSADLSGQLAAAQAVFARAGYQEGKAPIGAPFLDFSVRLSW